MKNQCPTATNPRWSGVGSSSASASLLVEAAAPEAGRRLPGRAGCRRLPAASFRPITRLQSVFEHAPERIRATADHSLLVMAFIS